MNILYVIGNGFDKAQNMETSYPEFYDYLMKNTDDASPLLQQVKKEINRNTELWSDMEMALCEFTKNVATVEEFESLHSEISSHLENFLRLEEEKFTPSAAHMDTLVRHFLSPQQFMYEGDMEQYNNIPKSNANKFYYRVITFNYTNTLQKIIGNVGRSFDENRVLSDMCYVHGKLGEPIIIGADRIEQIANEKFRESEVFNSFMIKVNANESLKRARHQRCESFIKEANLIVFFGLSFGATDQRWWDIIGSEMNNRGTLGIIDFEYKPQELPPQKIFQTKRVVDDCRRKLCEKMGITEEKVSNRVFAVVNSEMFNYRPSQKG